MAEARKRLGEIYTEESSYYNNGAIQIAPYSGVQTGRINVLELFSGCGGTSLGFETAGFNILAGADIHKSSMETFKKNHPTAGTIFGDLRKVSPKEVKNAICNERVDVLIGGIPCQGFSLGNKKQKDDDHRNFLYIEFMRFVKALQPKVVMIENVYGITVRKNGEFVKHIEKEFGNIGGYKVSYALLNAADYGVPQKRIRFVFVATKSPKPFIFSKIRKTHGPDTGNAYVTVGDALSDLSSLESGESSDVYKTDPANDYQRLMRSNYRGKLTCHKAPKHPQAVVMNIESKGQGEPLYDRFRQRVRLHSDQVSPTQVSGGIRPSFQNAHPIDNRGLTIRERCRLQSFPDDFEVLGGIVQGRVQTGNAVPPLLAKAIALQIKEQEF